MVCAYSCDIAFLSPVDTVCICGISDGYMEVIRDRELVRCPGVC